MSRAFKAAAAALAAVLLAGCTGLRLLPQPLSGSAAAPAGSAAPESAPAPSPRPSTAPGAENAAAPACQLEIELSGGEGRRWQALRDGSVHTKLAFAAGESFTFTAAEPIGGVYLILDRPALWQFEDGGAGRTRGELGFLHDFAALETPARQLTVTLPEGAVVCDVYAFSPGDPPDWVQVWQPPCQRADLLVLPTHADDEHLWFGGALPYYAAERGYAVQVAYMTNHWAEPYRPHELLDGLWTVGITHYPVVSGFPDLYASKASFESAAAVYGEETITEWQVWLLRRFKPSVVLGHDINGEYGHGAHMLNADTLLTALPAAADPDRYPASAQKYGVWQTPKCYLHLWPENAVQMEWGQLPLAAFGGRTALEMARAGFACHASQTAWFSVKEGGRNDCRKFGLAWTTVGPDVAKDDFFENID